jgi:hypothetical protein
LLFSVSISSNVVKRKILYFWCYLSYIQTHIHTHIYIIAQASSKLSSVLSLCEFFFSVSYHFCHHSYVIYFI